MMILVLIWSILGGILMYAEMDGTASELVWWKKLIVFCYAFMVFGVTVSILK